MFRAIFFAFFCLASLLNAAKTNLEELVWANGETLLTFFEKNKIPLRTYYNLETTDKELADEIVSGVRFWVLRDQNDELAQALIPISDDLQIHVRKNELGRYEMDFLPIEYEEEEKVLSIQLNGSPYQSIVNESGLSSLARSFVAAFKGTVDFQRAQKGDKLVIIYKQKRRMGKAFGSAVIEAAMIEHAGKIKYAYRFKDGYYDEGGREMERFFLITPVKNARISSHFNPARFHPVLKKYRAHLGTDYAAPRGTRVYAAGDGVISFVGTKGGYGKTVIIKHAGEYSTLYAHLNAFANVKNGKKVKQGELIAYVGNTGMSTGPHLHFGLYRSGTAINALRVLAVVKKETSLKEKQEFNQIVSSSKTRFNEALKAEHINAPKEEFFENLIPFS